MTAAFENREVARTALEQVCARGDMALAPRCYAEDFVDHVGRLEYHGLEGVRRSTKLYRAPFDDLAFEVIDQVAEADRVASRWVLTGSNRGRPVRLWGITISRLREGRIVEDWSAFDGLELLRRPRCLAHPPPRPSIHPTAAQAASGQTRALMATCSR
jgi:predicted ester cyclase